jgi:hypothetical protein
VICLFGVESGKVVFLVVEVFAGKSSTGGRFAGTLPRISHQNPQTLIKSGLWVFTLHQKSTS